MDPRSPFVLNEDVRLIAAADLDPETRRKIDCAEGEFAVSRLLGRAPSTVVDADGAALLERFRKPRSIVDAIVLYSRSRNRDPGEVLEEAHPLLWRFIDSRFLVPARGDDLGLTPRFGTGERVRDFEIARLIHFLEDVEVYQVRRGNGFALLKLERQAERPLGSIRHETEVLRSLAGNPAPRLLEQGDVDGKPFLLVEWCSGIDAEAAAAEWRRRPGGQSRDRLLDLCRSIASAYAELHRRRTLHGDVHPRNILIDGAGGVRLVNFALSRRLDRDDEVPRGAIAFFLEPELVASRIAGEAEPPASEEGEQYAVAALCYRLVTGAHYLDFDLQRGPMQRQILSQPPLAFSQRNIAPWPRLESVLFRALSKSPGARYASMAAFAEALGEVAPAPPAQQRRRPHGPSPRLARVAREVQDLAALEGPWLRAGLSPPPTASVTYGSAGLALALYRMASLAGDSDLLALADLWCHRACGETASDSGFYDREIEVTRDEVGETSPFHSPAGVWFVRALIAAAFGDLPGQGRSIDRFIAASAGEPAGLDLTLGRAGTLLGSALLLDSMPEDGPLDRVPLLALGRSTAADLARELDSMPEISEAAVEYLGVAHGWAGLLYALLQWTRAAGDEPASLLEPRLEQLGELAEPQGRGARWPIRTKRDGHGPTYMAGWCNGSAGFVFLWCLAARVLERHDDLGLAVAAGLDTYDAPDRFGNLCCGLAGRAYALLELFRATGDGIWLDRALELAEDPGEEQAFESERPQSLFKGRLGLALLAADLRHPERAALPLFQEDR